MRKHKQCNEKFQMSVDDTEGFFSAIVIKFYQGVKKWFNEIYLLLPMEFAVGEHRLMLLLVFPLCAADVVDDDKLSWLPFLDAIDEHIFAFN